jgi:hypothetical protein
MVALTSGGYAVAAATAGSGKVVGVAAHEQTVTVSSGDYSVNLLQGQFWCVNDGSVTIANVDKPVYATGAKTVSATQSAYVAGICRQVDSTLGVLVEIGSGTSAGVSKEVDIVLHGAILAAGTPMAAFADNASSNPGITLNDSEAMGIRWNNNASQTAVFTKFVVPLDCDVSKGATMVCIASKSGATAGDAVTFDLGMFNNVVGALHDADASYGGTTSAMTGNATAKTVQQVTKAVAAADLPVAGTPVTISFKPTDGTLGTDDVTLYALKFRYQPLG